MAFSLIIKPIVIFDTEEAVDFKGNHMFIDTKESLILTTQYFKL